MITNEEAREILHENRVEIALEDDREPAAIAAALGLIVLAPKVVDSAIEVSYNTDNE